MDYKMWANMYEEVPSFLSEIERNEWTKKLNGVALGSDAFFPFRDNIDRACLVSEIFILLIIIIKVFILERRFIYWKPIWFYK